MSGVLFYVQHLLGVGHLKRAEILATAMRDAGLDVTVALGGPPVAEIPFSGVRAAQLPPATIADGSFSAILDATGRPVDDAWRDARRDALLRVFTATAPDVVLIELFPFGRRQFRFELAPLLAAAESTAPRPRIACSVRDILVGGKGPARAREVAATVRGHFDAVLVHGDPAVIPFEATFEAAGEIADLLRYTGYVAAASPAAETTEGAGEVIVSAGGGAVGADLLFAAVAARPKTALAGRVWRFLAGPNLPAADFARLSGVADERTIVERFRPDFAARLRSCVLSISQAGYNTTMDLLAAEARAVVVPFETASETEQRRRAEILAAHGMLTVVPEAALTPQSLADGIAAALSRTRPRSAGIDLSGAATTARLVAELAAKGMPPSLGTAKSLAATCSKPAVMAPCTSKTSEGRHG